MTPQESLQAYIDSRFAELVCILEKYPRNVPVQVVSEYLGIAVETLRASLMSGNSPIGYAWRAPGNGRSSNYISTLPFVTRECGKLADWHRLMIEQSDFYKMKAVGL